MFYNNLLLKFERLLILIMSFHENSEIAKSWTPLIKNEYISKFISGFNNLMNNFR